MLRNGHVRFGGRPAETHQFKDWQGAADRPYNDWRKPGYDSIVAQSVWDATPDGIVLMHDIHEETVAAAGAVADGLLERGFTLVTVSQLFGDTQLPAD